jgi:hypothetical protein
MTIQFQGHVEGLTSSGNSYNVCCGVEAKVSPRNITFSVPKSEGQYWMPGRIVQFTAYTLPEKDAGLADA